MLLPIEKDIIALAGNIERVRINIEKILGHDPTPDGISGQFICEKCHNRIKLGFDPQSDCKDCEDLFRVWLQERNY